MKLFIDAGHGGADTGNVSRFAGVTYVEKTMAWEMALLIREAALIQGIDVKVVDKSQPNTQFPAKSRFVNRVAQSNAFKADVFISVHLNATSGNAQGCEAWYQTGDQASLNFGNSLVHEMSDLLGNTFRGAKPDIENRHGRLGILRGHREGCRKILIEPVFMDNLADLRRYLDKRAALAKMIATFVARNG
jgi:N-acetylmuramoyl-L-alanine amidase